MDKDLIYKEYLKLNEEYVILAKNEDEVKNMKKVCLDEIETLKHNIDFKTQQFDNEDKNSKEKFLEKRGKITLIAIVFMCIFIFVAFIIYSYYDAVKDNYGFGLLEIIAFIIFVPIGLIIVWFPGAIILKLIANLISIILVPTYRKSNRKILKKFDKELRRKELELQHLDKVLTEKEKEQKNWQEQFINLLERV